jgi:hypothetical protein
MVQLIHILTVGGLMTRLVRAGVFAAVVSSFVFVGAACGGGKDSGGSKVCNNARVTYGSCLYRNPDTSDLANKVNKRGTETRKNFMSDCAKADEKKVKECDDKLHKSGNNFGCKEFMACMPVAPR